MTTLTDTQHQILAQAASRPDGGVTLPKRGRAGPVAAQTLLAQGLVREVRSKADLPVWRVDDGQTYSLVLTKAGRAAVAGITEAAEGQRPAQADASGGDPAEPAGKLRSGGKLAEVVALLRRDQGTSVAEMMAVTGWLPHSTRAALTGLRKRGYDVVREAREGGSVYRIAAPAAAAA